MHYRHAFHAANFADVFKHSLLCGLLSCLNRKAAPWCFIETHAGAGRYRLDGLEAGRTSEWPEGLGRIWRREDAPAPISDYLRIVRDLQDDPNADEPRVYAGSPLIAAALAREGDRLVLCEKVPDVAEALRDAMAPYPAAAVHRRDGYEAAALMPPAQRRGLVLIDPPFERPDEFDAVAEFLVAARRRFAHGVYAVWYPLKKTHDAARFVRRVQRETTAELLNIEFRVAAPAEGRMQACGLLIVNPPFGFDTMAEPALRWLLDLLRAGPGAALQFQRQPARAP